MHVQETDAALQIAALRSSPLAAYSARNTARNDTTSNTDISGGQLGARTKSGAMGAALPITWDFRPVLKGQYILQKLVFLAHLLLIHQSGFVRACGSRAASIASGISNTSNRHGRCR